MRVTFIPSLPILIVMWQSGININPTLYGTVALMEVVWTVAYFSVGVVARMNALQCKRDMGGIDRLPETESECANWRIARQNWAIHQTLSIFGFAMAVGGALSMLRAPSTVPPDFMAQTILLILVSGAFAMLGLTTFVRRERTLIDGHIHNADQEKIVLAEALAATAVRVGVDHDKEVSDLQSDLASSEAARKVGVDAADVYTAARAASEAAILKHSQDAEIAQGAKVDKLRSELASSEAARKVATDAAKVREREASNARGIQEKKIEELEADIALRDEAEKE